MKNVYEECPVLENEKWKLRLIEEADVDDLWETYRDKLALPFFNSDNCHGNNFYCEKKEYMKESIYYWGLEYGKKGFVRFSIVNKTERKVIGTIELFNRKADDYFNDCGLLRLDVGSKYEEEEIIYEILELMLKSAYSLFECSMIATKSPIYAVDRCKALERLGFTKSEEYLVGQQDQKRYYDYWVK